MCLLTYMLVCVLICAYVCLCVYVYIYVYMHAWVSILHVCVHVCICIMWLCVYTCMQVCVCMCVHSCVYTYMNVMCVFAMYIQMCSCVCMHICVPVYMCVCACMCVALPLTVICWWTLSLFWYLIYHELLCNKHEKAYVCLKHVFHFLCIFLPQWESWITNNSIFNLWRTSISFFMVAIPVHMPANSVSVSLSALVHCLYDDSHLPGCCDISLWWNSSFEW